METKQNVPASIQEYIDGFEPQAREKMNQLYQILKELAPSAKEKIAWNMPTFMLRKNLFHFAGHKNHIGFYPTPDVIIAFEEELTGFKYSKGAVQFPVNQPLPVDLIKKMAEYRIHLDQNGLK